MPSSPEPVLTLNFLFLQLDQAFCLPFGNRRLLHCIPAYANTSMSQQGEVPAWEACGKVVKKETQDFYEFVVCFPLLLNSSIKFELMNMQNLLDCEPLVPHSRCNNTMGEDIGTGVRAV